ncbi:PREDICTED: uncharacterized protein LOC109352810 [Lupinus angustifolius]|uniref:uncharacterized protein LOC109352810 n=1 Tax=Lupinus angustifolius TaxID=3871 RepID=UPI00092F3ECB|nr:PREDICTED: uncharacterized protein LOC109352810 [Lupinus angustifolius]
MVLAGNNSTEIQHVKNYLDTSFKIKDLGPLRFFLGLEITRSKNGIHLNQRHYALSLLSDIGSLATKPSAIPFDPATKLQVDLGTPYHDPFAYRRLVGRLIYHPISRPDSSYVVQQLSLYMHKPMDLHYKVAMKVLHYLKQSIAQGLFFPSNIDIKLSAFADSDWACYPDTRQYITGFSFL